jgi:hypothetical protein
MSITITLSDSTANELRAALGNVITTTPGPTPTPTGTAAISYPVSRLTAADRLYLYTVEIRNIYKMALRDLPGSHQVFWDVLTDNFGKRWSDADPQPPGTTNNAALHLAINTAINTAATDPALRAFDFNGYAGPLRAIVAALIDAKLAGRA